VRLEGLGKLKKPNDLMVKQISNRLEVLSRYLSERDEGKSQKSSARTAGSSADIGTDYLRNRYSTRQLIRLLL
jgi:hypothetical protein